MSIEAKIERNLKFKSKLKLKLERYFNKIVILLL